jgi:hypothetical protein
MLKSFQILKRSRFLVNLNAELTAKIKSIFQIEEEETVLLVLDDSLFKNLKEVIVFTNERIYWNKKNASLKTLHGKEESVITGSSSISVKELKTASCFINKNISNNIVYIMGETVQLAIPLRHFALDESLQIVFYDYLSNYSGGYAPNKAKNEAVYSKYLKGHRKNKLFTIFDICSYAVIGIFLILYGIRQSNTSNIKIFELVIFISSIFKLLSIIFGNRKSVYLTLLLISIASIVFIIPPSVFPAHKIYLYLIYAGCMILAGIFNFDKIYGLIIGIIAVVTLILTWIKHFYPWIFTNLTGRYL